jgi:hypothetical protein
LTKLESLLPNMAAAGSPTLLRADTHGATGTA